MKQISVALEWEFAVTLGERHLIAFAAGPCGDLLALSSRQELNFYAPPQEINYRVHHWRAGAESVVDLPLLNEFLWKVQPLQKDYLLVRGRAASDADCNAHRYSANGELLGSWSGSDGIEDVQVAANGTVWVSYFDEGVFKSGGRMSQAGLNAFTASGERIFNYAECAQRNNLPPIDDCYALNVASNQDVWLCYYNKFPLVHLRDGVVKSHFEVPSEMRGSKEFAVSNGRVLFTGGYKDEGRVFGHNLHRRETRLLLPVSLDDEPLQWERAFARGSKLYLASDSSVWSVSLHEMAF